MARFLDTLGKAARHGMMVRVECLHCRHVGHHRADELARAVGYGTAFTSIRFKCSRCGRTDAKALPFELDRDRSRPLTVWTQITLKG
jgi:hypothetical protein